MTDALVLLAASAVCAGLYYLRLRELWPSLFYGALTGCALAAIGANVNNGLADVLGKLSQLPAGQKAAIEADLGPSSPPTHPTTSPTGPRPR